MYISKAVLNPQRRGAKRLLSSPQRMHAAVLASFAPGGESESAAGRILWRLDPGEHHVDLLVVSPRLPDLIGIVEEAGWPLTTPAQSKPYGQFLDRVCVGSQWHYRLRANPVHAIKKDGWDRSRRVGHVSAEHQAQWWIDRAAKVGLQLLEPPMPLVEPVRAADRVSVSERATLIFERHTDSGESARGRRVTISSAVFEGHAEVTDAALVRDALTHGVGRARAYGCGLLTLVAPRP